jgi:hypothetical protein
MPKHEKISVSTCVWKHLICVIAERILCRHHRQFSINMWGGIFGDYLVGSQVLPRLLTGNRYRDFLLYDLPKLLEDVPLAVRARMWYMHDGAPEHFSHAVRDVLKSTHHDRRIVRVGPTAWPPWSPDMNPLQFYLWERLQPFVYAAPGDNEEALGHHIVDACQTISNYPENTEWMGRSVMRRTEACIESHTGYSEHSLQMFSLRYNSKLNVSDSC